MDVLLLALAVAAALYGVMYLVCVRATWCKSKRTLHGKTVIVTGGNAGIGKTTAVDLARRGARVILACRNKQRAEAAVCDIIKESGSNQVVYMQLDLASLQSVRSFAETFLKQESRLDILINNAALHIHGRTEDGFGMIFGVNHIVEINMSPSIKTVRAIRTELARSSLPIIKILNRPIIFLFFKDPVAGAQTTLHCALQEGIEPLSGCYFDNCTVMDLKANARDDATAKKLWEISERFCGLA
ncbi:dehydrogenase/reductase SDR family member 13-like [Scleropages formosus]|uniref:dehydrogenase/reductase SDR family member 13-like n=1 Tax=Scleropages formosus TaxID=113540 RepID=UPI0010FA8165|nr:dehydrogenase/reductase SDR family member 13-like [Scleropages formosus]